MKNKSPIKYCLSYHYGKSKQKYFRSLVSLFSFLENNLSSIFYEVRITRIDDNLPF